GWIWDQKPVIGIEAAEARPNAEALRGPRPELLRRGTEKAFVRGKRLRVLLTELPGFFRRAPRWFVMKLAAQHPAAPDVPVIATVKEVHVPHLVDLLAGRHRCGRDAGKEAEAAIFQDRSAREIERPALMACKLFGEI